MKLDREKRIEIQKEINESRISKNTKDLLNRLLDESKLGLKLYFEESEEKIKNSSGIEVPISKQKYIYFKEEENKRCKHSEDNSSHLIIEGDNYLALKHLERLGQKVDIIYIDPPYNTGNGFVYNDKIVNKEDVFKHSYWLSFMKKRLILAKDLLNDDGVIFVSIDDNEQPYLRVLMDEIFGENEFLNEINWVSNKAGRQISNMPFAKTYEYILVYGKNTSEDRGFNGIDRSMAKKIMPSMYDAKDEILVDEIGEYISNHELHNLNIKKFNISNRPNLYFPIYVNFDEGKISTMNFDGSIEILPPISNGIQGVWRWSKDKVENESHNLLLVKKKSGDIRIQTKVRKLQYTLKDTILGPTLTTNSGSNMIKKLGLSFDNPKPVSLIKILLSIVEMNNNAIILDFFAGSGTTGQAVMELNNEDEGKRKFIGITIKENCDGTDDECIKNYHLKNIHIDGFCHKNVAEQITYERMHRIIEGEASKNEWYNGGSDFPWLKDNTPYKQNIKYLKVKHMDKFNGNLNELNKNKQLYKEEFNADLTIELIADE